MLQISFLVLKDSDQHFFGVPYVRVKEQVDSGRVTISKKGLYF